MLLEVLVRQMEEYRVPLAFCDYAELDSGQMEEALTFQTAKRVCETGTARWRRAEGEETERCFHGKYSHIMSGIGGKMIRRDVIGDLRFDENLINGEDTLFVYQLVCGQIGMAFYPEKWYYYRIHSESATHSAAVIRGKRYFECSRRIRDSEWQKGRPEYALKWEVSILEQMEGQFLMLKKAKDREACGDLRKWAEEEKRHPMFCRAWLDVRLLFVSCFCCLPLYYLQKRLFRIYAGWKEVITMRTGRSEAGILTFHCADNFGAMLQTYGLKTYLCRIGIETDVIRYEPPYMTGRYWLFPYIPSQWRKGIAAGIRDMLGRFQVHLGMGRVFFRRRKNMRRFRSAYLVDRRQPALLSVRSLGRLSRQYYIVGSDQIWNPEITFGLREAYFGAFKSKNKKKVIAYGASFGGEALSAEYDGEFSRLIKHVDAVSVREGEGIPYVKRFYEGSVTSVLDPVFFLERESWEKIEKTPDQKGYILVILTERNSELIDYVRELSGKTGLAVIEVSAGTWALGEGFPVDSSAGPSEFLGYIHEADYVVSNSFHAIAFSIIYQKRFLAFAHSSRGVRIRNILRIHGLEDRLWEGGAGAEIDAGVNWDEVRRRTEENAALSGAFLQKEICGGRK